MNRIFTAAALTFAVALAGCDSINSFDPLDKLSDLDIMGTSKKPLQGERRAVFPEGVPGVPEGVPPDMVKGYQAPAEQPPPVVEAKPEKPKPRPKRVAAPRKPRPQPQQTAQQPMRQAPASNSTTTQTTPAADAPWPTIPGAQPTWPTNAPPAPQTFGAPPPQR
jgi:hypothetical protein